MGWLRIFGARWRGLLSKRQLDQDLDAELRAHLEMLTEENIRRGMSPVEARYAARREFGGVEQTKELHRQQRSIALLDALVEDLRFALRGLGKRPAFALVAILTLALGIGSTTAVFSVVDRILFRSLPYPHDERLVSFGDKAPFEANEFVLGPDYVDWKKAQTPFESVTSFVPGGADCDLTERNPVRLKCALVESTFLPTFGIQPFLGRNFTSEEDRPNGARVALITYGLWRSRFASDRNLPGRTISLDGRPTLVVGVLPPQFEMPILGHEDILVPAALGATRARLARQALTESLLLGVLGGLSGCWFAQLLLRLFVSIAPEGIPRLEQATIDVRVLLFAFGLSLVSGVLFGLASALRRPLPELLTGKEIHATSRGVLRQALVTIQIAVSLVLLAGAGLLLRSLWKLETVSLGMDARSVITAGLDLAQYRYPDSGKQIAFFSQLESRLRQMPGITALGLSDTLPPSGGMQATFLSSIDIPGHAKFSAGTGGMIGYRYVTPTYFPALSVPILHGRGFREEDRSPAKKPVILSEALAKRLFPNGEDPLGKSFRFGSQNEWRTIVGIAGDVKNNGLD